MLWLLYPGGLTRDIQLALAAGVAAVNLFLYAWVFLVRPRWRQPRRPESGHS